MARVYVLICTCLRYSETINMFYGATVGASAACDQIMNYDKSIKIKVVT